MSAGSSFKSFVARFAAAVSAAQWNHRIRKAQARERKALVEAGAALAASPSPAVASDPAAQALRVKIDEMEVTATELRTAMETSLGKDREDWGRATQLMRWVVVHRGLLDRWILRDRMKYQRREADKLRRELGALAFDGAHDVLRALVPDAMRGGIEKARADIASAQAARAQRLAPWHGEPLPGWMYVAVRETREFLKHFWDQLSRRLFLRVPAIGALVAGWWIANHYSDSTLERIQRSMGFGGREHLSAETLAALKFWMPILCAAVCTYIVSAIAIRIQRKYAAPKENVTRASSP
jgi:hypothetical protein